MQNENEIVKLSKKEAVQKTKNQKMRLPLRNQGSKNAVANLRVAKS